MSELIAYEVRIINNKNPNLNYSYIVSDFLVIESDLYELNFKNEEIKEMEKLIDNFKDNIDLVFKKNDFKIYIKKSRMLKYKFISLLDEFYHK